jgi:hypothetical protein
MGLGALLGAAFRVLRRNPGPVVGFSLVIHVVLAGIAIAVNVLFTIGALAKYLDVVSTIGTTGDVSQASIAGAIGSLAIATASGLISTIFNYAGLTILQGVITMEVSRGTVGEKLRLSALWARARRRIGALLGWAGIVIVVTIVAFGIVFGGFVALIAFGGVTGAIVGGILIFVVGLGGVALVIWLSTKLSLVPSALIIERLTIRASVRRSWDLVKGYFWRTFGIELLVAVIVAIAAWIVEFPISLIIQVATLTANPTGLSTSVATTSTAFSVSFIVGTAVSALVETVTAIITTAVTALIYIDLRMRKEGLDLALMKFVDARAAGATDVPDPYLTADSLVPPATDNVT